MGIVMCVDKVIVICAWCKRHLRSDGSWVLVDKHPIELPMPQLSHGICPDCKVIVFEEFKKRRLAGGDENERRCSAI